MLCIPFPCFHWPNPQIISHTKNVMQLADQVNKQEKLIEELRQELGSVKAEARWIIMEHKLWFPLVWPVD
jgi:hypothetical protein